MKSLRDYAAVAKYLQIVTQDISDVKVKADIQEELLCHIESEVEKIRSEGDITMDKAIVQAIEQLGSPDVLSGYFFKVYYRNKHLILKFATAAAVIVMVIAGYNISQALSEAKTKQTAYVNNVLPYVEEYLSDVADLERSDIFKTSPHSKDAGEFRNERVEWAISDTNSHIKDRKTLEGPSRILPRGDGIGPLMRSARSPEQMAKIMANRLRGFLDTPSFQVDESMAAVDVSWMAQLFDYDYWDLHRTGPFHKLTKSEEITWNGDSSEVVLPDLRNFLTLANRRLAIGAKERDPLPALREVHQLAKLLYSTETMSGALTAIDIYDLEDIFVNMMVDAGVLNRGDYVTYPQSITFKAHRALEAAPAFLSYNLARDTETFHKIFGRTQLPPGTCGAFMKTVNMARMNREPSTFFNDGRAADPEYAHNNELLLQRLKSSCRLSYFRDNFTVEQWAKNLRDVEMPKHNFIEDMKIQNWGIWTYWMTMKVALEIPHVRNTYTRYMASENYPSFPSEYKDWNKFTKNTSEDHN